MALSADDWKVKLVELGIAEGDKLNQYARTFHENELNTELLLLLSTDDLKQMGIVIIGHQKLIQRYINSKKVPDGQGSNQSHDVTTSRRSIKASDFMNKLKNNVTSDEFQRFKADWKMLKQLDNISERDATVNLYGKLEDPVRTALYAHMSYDDIMGLNEEQFLDKLEEIVTNKVNPGVCRSQFNGLSQNDGESLKDFMIRLQSKARECRFTCFKCNCVDNDSRVFDRFLIGIRDSRIQIDLFTRINELKTLQDLLKQAEVYETAIKSQSLLANSNEISQTIDSVSKISPFRRSRQNASSRRSFNNNRVNACKRCGNGKHSDMRECPARKATCYKCYYEGHFKFCCTSKTINRNSSLYKSRFNNRGGRGPQGVCAVESGGDNTFSGGSDDSDTDDVHSFSDVLAVEGVLASSEISMAVTPLPSGGRNRKTSVRLSVFPDSGASICLGGPEHQKQLNLKNSDLLGTNKNVKVVGGKLIRCYGVCKVRFSVGKQVTEQDLFFCEEVKRLYFSKQSCIAVKILHETYPMPMEAINEAADDRYEGIAMVSMTIDGLKCQMENEGRKGRRELKSSEDLEKQRDKIQGRRLKNKNTLKDTPDKNKEAASKRILPNRPKKIPFAPTTENVQKLKEYLLDAFGSTTFNASGVFPTLNVSPMKIQLKSDAVPRAYNIPNTVSLHTKEPLKKLIFSLADRGIISGVDVDRISPWRSKIVTRKKKDGRIRFTADFSYLSSQCIRTPHPFDSPFRLASQVPNGTYKSVLDAVDGYFSIPLAEECRHLTTFITEWGTFQFNRAPQGFFNSGDKFNGGFDNLIKNMVRILKIVDDCLLYDFSIEEHFWHVWEFLYLCATNGIVLSQKKFQFCQMEVKFAGLNITDNGITPSDDILKSIRDFKEPTDVHGVRSWYGLVRQVAWAHSLRDEMEPFRELLKKNVRFRWDANLQHLFNQSKKAILEKVCKGVQTFEFGRPTILQSDWSKQGVGYLLLQKHCTCPMKAAPLCCADGWRIVFAGSRFNTAPESRYSPTEGEALAVAWGLQNAKYYTEGCPDLTVVTDHKPLLGIFTDRELGSVANTRIRRIKESTLAFRFRVTYSPGKLHAGPDALSRYPVAASLDDEEFALDSEVMMAFGIKDTVEVLQDINDDMHEVLTLSRLREACSSDEAHNILLGYVKNGFPRSKQDMDVKVVKFWGVKDELYAHGDLLLKDNRLIIPQKERTKVLKILHSAHQGCSGMNGRAMRTVFWPGISKDIVNFRLGCQHCERITPSQRKEPMVITPLPEWPFQHICMDYYEFKNQTYLLVVDRYSGWLMVYHFKKEATSNRLVSICREIFANYGVAETISTDGGPQFKGEVFKLFLKKHGINHRISSVDYPQSNGRAEVGVKTAKRLIMGNTNRSGSLDTDAMMQGLLQYRNTLLQNIGLSPAQILLHRNLKDALPALPSNYKMDKFWIEQAEARLKWNQARRVKKLCSNKVSNHKELKVLVPGTRVRIQNKRKGQKSRWTQTGTVVSSKRNRQYVVQVDSTGNTTLRNRRHIREMPQEKNRDSDRFLPCARVRGKFQAVSPVTRTAHGNPVSYSTGPTNRVLLSPESPPTTRTLINGTGNMLPQVNERVPRALTRLLPFNKPGRRETV